MPSSRKARLLERAAASILLSASISTAAIAQNTPARVRLETTQIDVQPDGTAIETNHRELQVFTAKAAMQLAQFPISYVESMQDIDITEAYTLKADGRKLAVEASAVLTQQAPQAANAPLFTDMKQKVVIFPNVEVGDTLVLTAKRHDKQAYFKGRFTRQSVFSPLTAVAQYDLTISIPKRLSSTLEAHDIEFQKSSSGDKDVYKAHYENLNPEAEDVAAISAFDRLPRYFISTFKNYDEMGAAYAALFAPKVTVSAKVKAQADSITAGITDRREQARHARCERGAVIDQQQADHAYSSATGRRSSTVAPPSSLDRTISRPPSSAARSRIERRPTPGAAAAPRPSPSSSTRRTTCPGSHSRESRHVRARACRTTFVSASQATR
jgi:hypothetical protein